MPERVIVTIKQPSGNDLGQVAEGYYTVEGDRLTMTYADGRPVLVNGERVSERLGDGVNPKSVAGRLTREVRRALKGMSETEEAFWA